LPQRRSKAKSKPVLQIDSKTGKVIAKYDSSVDAKSGREFLLHIYETVVADIENMRVDIFGNAVKYNSVYI